MSKEFEFKKNVKIVVDFEVGETILIEGWGYKLNGKHTIQDFKTNFGGCESGIMVMISGYDSWIDLGWLTKLPPPETIPCPQCNGTGIDTTITAYSGTCEKCGGKKIVPRDTVSV